MRYASQIRQRGGHCWSFSVYRVNFDYEQGFTDVSAFPVTFGIGLADRAELFGAWSVVTRIDRDVRPLFFPTVGSPLSNGGVVNEYPFVKTLLENAELRIEIEGHTCNIGTSEYNLALGETRRLNRRAALVVRIQR